MNDKKQPSLADRLRACLPVIGDSPDESTWCCVLGSDLREAVEELTRLAELKAAGLSILLGASPTTGSLSLVPTKRLTVLGSALRAFAPDKEMMGE